jgi:hypothetical protein
MLGYVGWKDPTTEVTADAEHIRARDQLREARGRAHAHTRAARWVGAHAVARSPRPRSCASARRTQPRAPPARSSYFRSHPTIARGSRASRTRRSATARTTSRLAPRFQLGDAPRCAELLTMTGHAPEAALFARTFAPR